MYAINTLLHLSLHKPLNHWNNSVLLTLRAEVCVRLKAASVQGLFPFVAASQETYWERGLRVRCPFIGVRPYKRPGFDCI
jgi:hypothetical protein